MDTMQDVRPDLAALGALFSDPSRAAMLWSLMDGQRRPAGELARIAGLSPQAASAHFAKLAEGGLIVSETRGRWRYYSLAGSAAAELIERMASFKADDRAPQRRTVASLVPAELRFARSCYDHLAGQFALQLLDSFREREWLLDQRSGLAVTAAGRAAFEQLGIEVAALEREKRPLTRSCTDWTERQPHLAGALGAAVLASFLARGWLVRVSGGRALRITADGRDGITGWMNDGFQRVIALNLERH